MAEKLENSPEDKHKAQYGDLNQASYLIKAKDQGRESKKPYNSQQEGAPADPFIYHTRLASKNYKEEIGEEYAVEASTTAVHGTGNYNTSPKKSSVKY